MSDKINSKITGTMASLDGITPAEPKPFLLTRINAALQRNRPTVWSKIAMYIKNPAIAGFSILLLLLLNIAVLSARNFLPVKASIAKHTVSSKYDFSINVSGIYDTENQEP